jgi:hypothetical protein
VEAVSVHPVGSTNDSNTSGFTTFGSIGLSLTPVLVLQSFTVGPFVTLSGLVGTNPVSLDVRLDHLGDLFLFFLSEDRYEFTAPFAADSLSVVPVLLLFEDFEVNDHFVSNSLEVSGFVSSFLFGSNSSGFDLSSGCSSSIS